MTTVRATVLTIRVKQVAGHWIKVADVNSEAEAKAKLAEWIKKGHEAAIFENSKKRG